MRTSLVQLEFVKGDGQFFAAHGREATIRRRVQHGLIAGQRGLAVDARFKAHRMDDPQLWNAKARIKRSLAPNVVGIAGIGYPDDEKRVAGGSSLSFVALSKNTKSGSR